MLAAFSLLERATNRFRFPLESQKSQSRVKLCNLNDHGTTSFSQKASENYQRAPACQRDFFVPAGGTSSVSSLEIWDATEDVPPNHLILLLVTSGLPLVTARTT